MDGGKTSLAMPRGTGKTTIALCIAIWALVHGHLRFLVIVAANKKEAKKILDAIKDQLRQNKLLAEDFPEVVYPIQQLKGTALLARGQLHLGEPTNITWTAEEIVFPTISGSRVSGARVVTVGINGAIRGKNADMPDGSTARPDMVIIDDPQSEKTAASLTMSEKIEEIINKTINGLGESGTRLSQIMCCTVIREGDVADRYLSHDIYPQWHGMRYKLLDAMPENTALWDEYADLRRDNEKKATAFYKKNRKEMDKGAISSWEDCFDSRCEVSALQAGMNLYIDDPISFSSEQQNAPIRPGVGTVMADAKTIRRRLNGLDRGLVPANAEALTAMIDVHDDILYWAVTAWSGDFTGWVIDYGTFPEQSRSYFKKTDRSLHTMPQQYKGRKPAIIAQGVEFLANDLMGRMWEVENDPAAIMQIDKLLVDSRYMHKAIETAMRQLRKSNIKPSLGVGVSAKTSPINQWPKKDGRKFGDYWIEDKPAKRSHRTVTMDVNYWKGQVHDSFNMQVGDVGSLSFFGKQPERHRMFSEHCNAEIVQFVSAKFEAYEWTPKPDIDNHYFDCIVGCMVAASHTGIKSKETHVREPIKQRKVVTF